MPSTTRTLLEQTLKHLPEDASLDQAIEQLLFLATIEEGLQDLDKGRSVSHNDVLTRFKP